VKGEKSAKPGRWPVLPIAPAIVAAIAIATAVLVTLGAADQLQATSDEAAALRSKALAATLAARLRTAPAERHAALIARASRRTGASFLLVDQDGTVLVDESLATVEREEVLRLMSFAEGLSDTAIGRARFAASKVSPPNEHLSVMAFVEAPNPAEGTVRLSNAIAVLTLLLLGVAVTVALLFTRTARDDVAYVRQRIADMARGSAADATGGVVVDAVPLRSLDQVGLLTAGLNDLIQRFASAEQGYREDLRAAARLDNERSQFLAGLSHELRTPLNAILGFTHLLESEDDGPLSYDAKEALGMIRTSGEHLKGLIDDILDLSAMETGQLRLSRSLVDALSVAEEVVREARGTVKDRPVALSVMGERGNIAWADPRRLRQALTNLVSNALKATAQGEVRVTVGQEGDMITIEVSDSGRGIEPEVLQTIFEPYKQAGDVQTRRGGAGLGLAITRRLVQLHGGKLTAVSELGRGSVFKMTVPDDSHSESMPRDSLVPFSDSADVIANAISGAEESQ
jgi:signal transduction histidine kinase